MKNILKRLNNKKIANLLIHIPAVICILSLLIYGLLSSYYSLLPDGEFRNVTLPNIPYFLTIIFAVSDFFFIIMNLCLICLIPCLILAFFLKRKQKVAKISKTNKIAYLLVHIPAILLIITSAYYQVFNLFVTNFTNITTSLSLIQINAIIIIGNIIGFISLIGIIPMIYGIYLLRKIKNKK